MSVWKDIVRKEDGPQLEQDYTLGRVLGKGAFGVVRLALDKKTGQMYACKSISKAKLISPEDVEDVRREVDILNLVSPHHTVAGLKSVYEDRNAVHIVMELCVGGELFERIVSKGTFSEADAARFFRSMVEMVRGLSGDLSSHLRPAVVGWGVRCCELGCCACGRSALLPQHGGDGACSITSLIAVQY
jgi:calcium-dependent protein kinase